MSTLKVNDIQEATSGGGKIWPARAWVNFNGTGTIAIRDDGNVSSLTDHGTGEYSQILSNALANANYAVVCTAGDGSNNSIWEHFAYNTTYTTSSFRYRTGTTTALYDTQYNNLIFVSSP